MISTKSYIVFVVFILLKMRARWVHVYLWTREIKQKKPPKHLRDDFLNAFIIFFGRKNAKIRTFFFNVQITIKITYSIQIFSFHIALKYVLCWYSFFFFETETSYFSVNFYSYHFFVYFDELNSKLKWSVFELLV